MNSIMSGGISPQDLLKRKNKMFNLKPSFAPVPIVKPSYNVGALLDIPTGTYETGKYGESILNGGLGSITGVTGIGNNFKSTIMHYMMLSAMCKFPESHGNTYDTEVNVSINRTRALASVVHGRYDTGAFDDNRWTITDKSIYHGNVWFEELKKYMDGKIENAKSLLRESPFLDKDGKNLFKMIIPTFTELDSLTKFDTESSNDMQEDNELGDSSANTLYMKEGQAKKRLLNSLIRPVQLSNNYMLISAHIGKDIPMDPRAAPIKKLQFLKNNDVIKGATTDFSFLTTNCWQCQNAVPLINDGTKSPEYPRDSSDSMKGDTDLNIVNLIQLRSKTGPSGLMLQLIVSQQEGVLPSLSEFHYIKINDRFGLGGNVQNYYLELLPDVKLSRTVVRGKIDTNARLRRALTITAEMSQMTYMWHNLPAGLMCTPKELYDDLIKLGYDWDTLLDTRSWWTYDNDKHLIPYLSTLDLLKMRVGEYVPYWMDENKKLKKNYPGK